MLLLLAAFTSRWFGLIILLAAIGGYFTGDGLSWVLPNVSWLLAIIMLGMGLTLTPRDFVAVSTHPRAVVIGVTAQFVVMPGLAWLLARAMHLPPEIAVGLILVGACPGGTASNVIAYLARADVALSVTLTTISTLLAPLLTPALTFLLADAWMEVSLRAMCFDVVKVVVAPVALGVVLHRLAPRTVAAGLPALPIVSVAAIALIVAAVLGAQRARLVEAGLLVGAAVVLHNLCGLALGYAAARLARCDAPRARTIAIEVGMQNSGLAVALARAHFGAAATLPGALFSVWHNLSGALLAAWWARRTATNAPPAADRSAGAGSRAGR